MVKKQYRKFSARLVNGQIESTPAAWILEYGYESLPSDNPLTLGENVTNYYEIVLVSKEIENLGIATTTLGVWGGNGDKEEDLDVSGKKIREIKKNKYTLLPEWKHLAEFGLPEVDIQTLVSEYILLGG